MRTFFPHNPLVSHWKLRWIVPRAARVLAFFLALLATSILTAQKPAAAAPHTPPHPAAARASAARARAMHRTPHPRRRSVALQRRLPARMAPPVTAAQQAPAVPAAPPPPAWPVNEKPVPATVTWDSSGLRIDAANSSLVQILRDVSTDTGVKVEGLSHDERIFGDYGPGPAREVISQLLHGSGYNIFMVGDQGAGTPLQIVLTPRSAGPVQPAANESSDNDDDSDLEDQQPSPPPYRPGFGPGDRGNPMERMREMQMRMRGREQQPGQPDNQPN